MIHIGYEGRVRFKNKYGFLHRINGPAYISKNIQLWVQNGKYHRINGPAYIDRAGHYWYIEGKEYTESEYYNKLKEMGLE